MNRRDFLKGTATVASLAALPHLASAQEAAPAPAITKRAYRDTDVKVSLLGFGMMRLPNKDGEIDQKLVDELVDTALKGGINYFDTAYFYLKGKSEIATGIALRKHPRDSYYLADKMPGSAFKSKEDLERTFNDQLKKTGHDYFDFYLVHALNGRSWKQAEATGVYEFLAQKKAEGKIKRLGFSFHDKPEVLQLIASAHPWDFAQIQLNYIDWFNTKAREQYEILTKLNIPVVIMEPLRGGALASLSPAADTILKNAKPDVSVASWGFRYAASLPNVLVVLSGMNRMEHLKDNLKTFSPFVPLSDDERKTLNQAIEAYRKQFTIPCTACEYCQPCPVGVQIPRIFAAYNQFKKDNNQRRFKGTLMGLDEDERPSACIACGKCMDKCPQHIKIPVLLKDIAKLEK